jgi:plastocyanin
MRFSLTLTSLAIGLGCGSSNRNLNNCPPNAFVDFSQASASAASGPSGALGPVMPVIYFGGADDSGFFSDNPACVTISVGQQITFAGTFLDHPLMSGTSPTERNTGHPGPDNPLVDNAPPLNLDLLTWTFTFTEAGTYPFFCANHYNEGEMGVISVVAAPQ